LIVILILNLIQDDSGSPEMLKQVQHDVVLTTSEQVPTAIKEGDIRQEVLARQMANMLATQSVRR